MAAATISEYLDDIGAALDQMVELDPGDAPDAEVAEAIVSLSRVLCRAEGVQARWLGAFDARKIWLDDGARSAATWLAQSCRLPVGAARAGLRFARSLRSMPLTEAALLAGTLGMAHARRLARAARRCRRAFARDESLLVEHAQSLRYGDFERAVQYWEQLAEPDQAEDDAKDADAARSLHLSKTFDNTWVLDGTCDAMRGSIISQVLSLIDDELFEEDWAEAKARLGDGVTPQDLARTPAQRRLDALVVMAVRAATAPADGKPPRPLFTVLVDYPTLSGRILELSNGMVVTPGQAAAYLSEADIERVVFDGRSRVLDVGERQRLFRGATRRAVEVRDRFCTGFGCDEPAERCDVDHILPFAAGGPTVQDNGRLRCPVHHPGRRKDRSSQRESAGESGPDPP